MAFSFPNVPMVATGPTDISGAVYRTGDSEMFDRQARPPVRPHNQTSAPHSKMFEIESVAKVNSWHWDPYPLQGQTSSSYSTTQTHPEDVKSEWHSTTDTAFYEYNSIDIPQHTNFTPNGIQYSDNWIGGLPGASNGYTFASSNEDLIASYIPDPGNGMSSSFSKSWAPHTFPIVPGLFPEEDLDVKYPRVFDERHLSRWESPMTDGSEMQLSPPYESNERFHALDTWAMDTSRPADSASSAMETASDVEQIKEEREARYETPISFDPKKMTKDEFLVKAKQAGLAYKAIKHLGRFREAESTLRGRYRSLTKRREERVRKPVWLPRDIELLHEAVSVCLRYKKGGLPYEIYDAEKISWKDVARYIVNHGGSYSFGITTCKKKWLELRGNRSYNPPS